MLIEFLIRHSKFMLKTIIQYFLAFLKYGSLIYFFVDLLSKIFKCCFTYVLYFMTILLNHFLKEIVNHSNSLCFDLLKVVYEQNPNVKSYFDIIDLLKKKNEPRFDNCISGLSTVLSRHCSRMLSITPNSIHAYNQEHWNAGLFGIGNCVNQIFSVVSKYCNWTDSRKEFAQKTNVNSLFDYFSFDNIEQKKVPSFENCEGEITNVIRDQCYWLYSTNAPKPIELGFIFNSFERVCFEQQKDLGVELCVNGLNKVISENCALEKWQSVVLNNVVTNYTELVHFLNENCLLLFFGIIVNVAVVCIFKKVYHFLVYGNDFLKKHPQGKKDITIINNSSSDQDLVDVINKLKKGNPSEVNVLGLDCEITSNTTNGGRPLPALLQLARPDGYCVIFQLHHMQEIDKLMEILNNEGTLLVGVGVMNDVDNLKVGWGLVSKRCLDIRHLAANLNYKHPLTLKDLASKVLNVNCKKNAKLGPWETLSLNEKQIKYAAQDALLSVEIFMKLNNQKICQSFGWLQRLFWSQNTYWKHTLTMWKYTINEHYDLPQQLSYTNKISLQACLPPNEYISYSKNAFQPESMLQLRFCVVCGSTDHVSMKAIVPLEYRIKFSINLPQYLDMCNRCIITNQKEDFTFRNQLADMCGVSYPEYMTEKLLSLKLLCKGVLENRNRMDDPVINAGIKLLIERLSVRLNAPFQNLTFRNIEIISNLDCWPFSSSHAAAVCGYFLNDTEMIRSMWCKHFILSMKPGFLPESWQRFYRTESLYTQNYLI